MKYLCFVQRFSSVPSGEFLEPQAAVFPAFNPPWGGVMFIAWRLRHPFLGECRRGPRCFWSRQARLGDGPVLGPTKKALCYTRPSGGTFVKYQYWKIYASCWGFSANCLESVPDRQYSMANLRPKGPRLRLGQLRVGKLLHWHLCHPCIALDLVVQFKL